MNPEVAEMFLDNMILTCGFLIEDEKQPFTKEQKEELRGLLNKATDLKKTPKNVAKLDSLLRVWDAKYQEYGGNMELKVKKVSEAEDVFYKSLPFGIRQAVKAYVNTINKMKRPVKLNKEVK